MARRKKGIATHGWLALDKPRGMTSTKAVSVIKTIFNAQKVGHAGTLDPEASGLLPIALGEATKTVPFAVNGGKSYEFEVKWGEETNTDDVEGEIVQSSTDRPDEAAIRAILGKYTGLIEQVPPQFSAIKINGERAYHRARSGEEFELAARQVQVDDLRLVSMPDNDRAVFEADCGKGTYIRAIARDMGRDLGCFGHVTVLRRTVVKPFEACDMILLETLQEMLHKGADRSQLLACLMPIETVLDDIPALPIDQYMANDIRQGRAVILRGRDAPVNQDLVLVSLKGKPVGLATVEKGMLKPKRVFNLS